MPPTADFFGASWDVALGPYSSTTLSIQFGVGTPPGPSPIPAATVCPMSGTRSAGLGYTRNINVDNERTTFNDAGWGAYVRTAGTNAGPIFGALWTQADLAVSTTLSSLCDRVVVDFQVENAGAAPVSFDFGIVADLFIGVDDPNLTVTQAGMRFGKLWVAPTPAFVTSYFGPYTTAGNAIWIHTVPVPDIADMFGAAWTGLSLEIGKSAVLSLVFGTGDMPVPPSSPPRSAGTETVQATASRQETGQATASHVGTAEVTSRHDASGPSSKVALPDDGTTSGRALSNAEMAAIGGAAALVVLVTAIALSVCLCRRRRERALPEEDEVSDVTQPDTSRRGQAGPAPRRGSPGVECSSESTPEEGAPDGGGQRKGKKRAHGGGGDRTRIDGSPSGHRG
jgi:hypothetical protein